MNKEFIVEYFYNIKKIMEEYKDYLIELDQVVGDGDLGLTMSDGFSAAYNAIKDTVEIDIGKLLYTAGKSMSVAVPSTMGTLMAAGLMEAGKVLKGKTEIEMEDMATFFMAYEEGVMRLGKAKIGEKTFLDGLDPAIISMKHSLENGSSMRIVAQNAALAAEEGFRHTVSMLAIHGRAATRGEASRNLLDPGAAVAMLLMKAFETTILNLE